MRDCIVGNSEGFHSMIWFSVVIAWNFMSNKHNGVYYTVDLCMLIITFCCHELFLFT